MQFWNLEFGLLMHGMLFFLVVLSGCSTTCSMPASKSRDWTRGYSVPPEQLRTIVLRTLQGDTLKLPVLDTVSHTIETDYDSYPGRVRGFGPGKKQWEERSRYFIEITSASEHLEGSILKIYADSEERRSPGYSWENARDSLLSEHRIKRILHLIDEEVQKAGG